MKDLYRKLGIDPKASNQEVAAALELKPEMSKYATILRDEEKRTGYNQAHATLNAIGILRHRLGLDSGDSWFLENCPDFAPGLLRAEQAREVPKPASQDSMMEKNHQDPQRQEPIPGPSAGTKQSLLIVAGVVAGMLAILAYVFL